MSNVYVITMTITPEQAAQWLQKNRNRTLRVPAVERLASAILRGEWVFNGESIKIDEDGYVVDGQHRLEAIVLAGTPITSVVVRGLPSGAQETVDTGAIRSLADILKMRGEQDPSCLAAALRWLMRYQDGRMAQDSGDYASRQQFLRLLDENPKLRESARFGATTGRRTGLPPAIVAALHYVFAQLNDDDADAFFEQLAAGASLPAGSPILALRQWRTNSTKGNSRPRSFMVAAYTIKAWNHWRAGALITNLRWAAGGSSPEPFPEAK